MCIYVYNHYGNMMKNVVNATVNGKTGSFWVVANQTLIMVWQVLTFSVSLVTCELWLR